MINKYTLIYKDSKLENIYQQYMNVNFRVPLFKKFIISTTLMIIIGIFEMLALSIDSFQNQTNQWIQYICAIVFEIIFFLIYKFKPQYIKNTLFLSNHVLTILYTQMDMFTHSQQLLYTIGIIVFQIVNALQGEFIQAVYQTIVFGCFYTIKAFLNDMEINYTLMAMILAAIVLLISAFYENIRALRSQFKLSQIDDQWEEIFKTLIKDKDYMFLYYNETSYSFCLNQQCQSQNVKNTQELRDFLRQNKSSNKLNLEQELFKTIKGNKNQENIINREFVVPQNNEVKILYSIFYGFKTIVLLQFKYYSIQQLYREQRIEKMYQCRYKAFLQLIVKLGKQFNLHQNSRKMICQLRKYCLYAYLKDIIIKEGQLFISEEYISPLNCSNIMKTISSIYLDKQISFNNYITTEILGCKQIILFILIKIIETAISSYINFHFEEENREVFTVKLFCYYNEKSLELLANKINSEWFLLVNVHYELWYICVTFKTFQSIYQFKYYLHENQINLHEGLTLN